jgi:hypothetical protein
LWQVPWHRKLHFLALWITSNGPHPVLITITILENSPKLTLPQGMSCFVKILRNLNYMGAVGATVSGLSSARMKV